MTKEPKREPFAWSDDDFLAGWNSVYNDEPKRGSLTERLQQPREKIQSIGGDSSTVRRQIQGGSEQAASRTFGGSYNWETTPISANRTTQRTFPTRNSVISRTNPVGADIIRPQTNNQDRLFLEGFYDIDGATSDYERAERSAQVENALLDLEKQRLEEMLRRSTDLPNVVFGVNKNLSPQKTNYSLAQNQNVISQKENPDLQEFGENSATYKILQDLGDRWMNGTDSEKEELHAVAEEVRRLARGGNEIKDAHDEIMELLHRNAKEATDYQKLLTEGVPGVLYDIGGGNATLDSALFLIGMTNRGPWDYKRDEYWQVPGNTFDGKELDEHNHRNWLPWMYFDGKLLSADKLGNMNMAYVGKKMGLPEWIYKNPATTDKDDAFWVQYGIDLANSGR